MTNAHISWFSHRSPRRIACLKLADEAKFRNKKMNNRIENNREKFPPTVFLEGVYRTNINVKIYYTYRCVMYGDRFGGVLSGSFFTCAEWKTRVAKRKNVNGTTYPQQWGTENAFISHRWARGWSQRMLFVLNASYEHMPLSFNLWKLPILIRIYYMWLW